MATTVIADPIYMGEGKWFKFTVTDEEGVAIDLSTATKIFHIKESVDDLLPLFVATEWDVTNAATGIIKANLPATETLQMEEKSYYGQLLIVLTADTDVDISQLIRFKIKKALVIAP